MVGEEQQFRKDIQKQCKYNDDDNALSVRELYTI